MIYCQSDIEEGNLVNQAEEFDQKQEQVYDIYKLCLRLKCNGLPDQGVLRSLIIQLLVEALD